MSLKLPRSFLLLVVAIVLMMMMVSPAFAATTVVDAAYGGGTISDLIQTGVSVASIFTEPPISWFVYLALISVGAGIVGRYIGKRKR